MLYNAVNCVSHGSSICLLKHRTLNSVLILSQSSSTSLVDCSQSFYCYSQTSHDQNKRLMQLSSYPYMAMLLSQLL